MPRLLFSVPPWLRVSDEPFNPSLTRTLHGP